LTSPENEDYVTVSNRRNEVQYNQWLRIKPSGDNVAFQIIRISGSETEASSIGNVQMLLTDGSGMIAIRQMAAHESRVFKVISHLKQPYPKGAITFTIDHTFSDTRGVRFTNQ
jgi:hypothetical protein